MDERADEYATQEGLFLIKPWGDTVAIVKIRVLWQRLGEFSYQKICLIHKT
jgi:hypothetical protein